MVKQRVVKDLIDIISHGRVSLRTGVKFVITPLDVELDLDRVVYFDEEIHILFNMKKGESNDQETRKI